MLCLLVKINAHGYEQLVGVRSIGLPILKIFFHLLSTILLLLLCKHMHNSRRSLNKD
jgi:hypothetical protein